MKGGNRMQTLYVIGSVNDAMRGKRLLEKYGIRAYVRKVSAENGHGCGYGLTVPSSSAQAVSVLRRGGVTVQEIREREGT